MSELTASDVLAMTKGKDGFLEGNGIIILILFFLIFGFNGMGFGNNGNNAAAQGALTRAELYDGLNVQDIQNSITSLNSNMNNGFAGVQQSLCSGFAGVNQTLSNGFNGVNQNLNTLGYQMQQCCCDLKTTMHSEGEETRKMIADQIIQTLRDKVADKDREILATGLVTAQSIQTNNLETFMRTLINGCGCTA